MILLSIVLGLMSQTAFASGPLGAAASTSTDSFGIVRDEVYAHPEGSLPCYPGLTPGTFVRAVLGLGGELVLRAAKTLASTDALKPAAPKILHPNGVCAEATWTIDGQSQATGLFATGTQTNAMVRFSTADARTLSAKGKNRIFGFAVKLFPVRADGKQVASTNILTLGEKGQTGAPRASYLVPSDKGEAIYFSNEAPGGGIGSKVLGWVLKRFDKNPIFQPLRESASVTADGKPVAHPVSPGLIRLVPDMSHAARLHTAADFRSEILQYDAGEIRFNVELTDGTHLGTLVVGKPVVSKACDEELTFHHTLNL
jgi:hypothetical protein